MKISFSRKGFDSSSGGVPSPIIDGRPVSLPIPTNRRSLTTYNDIGLGEIVARVTKNRLTGDDLCHHDPMFDGPQCAFGQTGAAQSHLARHGFGAGDVFLFFGLFVDDRGRDRHHRIFGYLHVTEVINLGTAPDSRPECLRDFRCRHSHTIGEWNDNNTLYVGRGGVAKHASPKLRLSKPGGGVSRWRIPDWLRTSGLSYHANPERWSIDGELQAAARGQEFIADTGNNQLATKWIENIIREIDEGASS